MIPFIGLGVVAAVIGLFILWMFMPAAIFIIIGVAILFYGLVKTKKTNEAMVVLGLALIMIGFMQQYLYSWTLSFALVFAAVAAYGVARISLTGKKWQGQGVVSMIFVVVAGVGVFVFMYYVMPGLQIYAYDTTGSTTSMELGSVFDWLGQQMDNVHYALRDIVGLT